MNEHLKKSILIVDDVPANISILGDTLAPDYEIRVATSGPVALEIAASEPIPDLVLLDIMMPEMDGYEVCQRLKSDIRTQDIPVIFISAKSEDEDETAGFELGVVDYIAKPFSPAIVQARVRIHLELKEHRDRLEGLVDNRTEELSKSNTRLQASEERLKLLFESAPDAYFLIDFTGSIVDVNKEVQELTGYDRKDLVGKTLSSLTLLAEDQLDSAIAFFRRYLGGESAVSHELAIQRKNNEQVFVETRVFQVKINEQEILLAACRDITERREYETQLRQSQKMGALGILAGGIAHDFNNILFPIIGYSEMMLEEVPDGGTLQKYLKQVIVAAYRAKDIVGQILVFSRQSEQEFKSVKIQHIIKEVLGLIRVSLPSTIKIRENLDKECGAVSCDSAQIHQVVMNLCTNAYHAMNENGGFLEVSLAGVEFDSEETFNDPDMAPGPYVKIGIKDTGCGIEKKNLVHIFDPFFTTKQPGKGTGMGLSVAHGIISSHEGTITVESEPGMGSTFYVYLPLAEKRDHADEEPAPDTAETGNEYILVVDDEEPIAKMEQQILERLGYHVAMRTSSVEALEAFRAEPDKYDLVITDMTMPEMTGEKLAKELMKTRPDIPVVLCTGISEEMDEACAGDAGICKCLQKPVSINHLAAAVRNALDN